MTDVENKKQKEINNGKKTKIISRISCKKAQLINRRKEDQTIRINFSNNGQKDKKTKTIEMKN